MIKEKLSNLRKGLRYIRLLFFSVKTNKFGSFGEGSGIEYPFFYAGNPRSIRIGKRVWINSFAKINVFRGSFMAKDNCSIGQGLTVVPFNHIFTSWKEVPESDEWRKLANNEESTIVINEHCWIGANVTMLAGCEIGRGSLVAAGSVCTKKKYPPYSIIGGNPAKVLRMRLSLEEQILHEKEYFIESDRIPEEVLAENYRKYKKKEQ